MRRRRNQRESGFALLLVFLMAALVAISLYMEIPRVAFDTQRQKEQLLVERGEQYKRAIKLFVSPKGIGRWPAKIEDLENFNNRRFLRHRFVDPFTGKDDWRLVHIQNGILTDSVSTKKKNPLDPKDGSSGAVQSSVGTLSSVSAIPDGSGSGQLNLNPALRRRASEGGASTPILGPDGQPVAGGTPAVGPDGQPYPGYSGASTVPPGGAMQPYPGGQVPGGGQPGQLPGQSTPYPGMPGPPVNSQMGGVSPSPYPTQGGSQGQSPYFGQQGLQGAGSQAQQSAAAAIINNILMTPNPRGLAGVQNTQGNLMGGGIAGVASVAESDSIMIYNDHSKYNEWEFIFDPTKERPLPNPSGGGAIGTPASQMGTSPFTPGPAPGGAGATMPQTGLMPGMTGTMPAGAMPGARP